MKTTNENNNTSTISQQSEVDTKKELLKEKRKRNRLHYATSRICVKLAYCQELRRAAMNGFVKPVTVY